MFEEVLGWTHGVQFVCLAFQNVMAAHIDGQTIHHWSGIPAQEADGCSGTKDSHKLSTKCQCLRFILIDEISMVSAELLAALEHVVASVVRLRSTYKRRADGSDRIFGGINVLFFGDWWQLRPVGGCALFSNPCLAATASARRGMSFFWGTGRDSIHRVWELTRPMRCVDAWYNTFLNACRNGALPLELYNAFQGFPTLLPSCGVPDQPVPSATGAAVAKEPADRPARAAPSTVVRAKAPARQDNAGGRATDTAVAEAAPATTGTGTRADPAQRLSVGVAHREHDACRCAEDLVQLPGHQCVKYKRRWAEMFLNGASGAELMGSECGHCQATRRKRARVLPLGAHEPHLHREPFVSAPAIYNYNVPKYWAVHLRAREFAKQHNRQLSWAFARDIPLFQDDRALPAEQLHMKRCRWLERHDQQTSHLSSVFPCVYGLPVRLTDAIDRDHGLYRGRRGRVVGWAPHPEEERTDVDGEWVLSHLPSAIYVHFPGLYVCAHSRDTVSFNRRFLSLNIQEMQRPAVYSVVLRSM